MMSTKRIIEIVIGILLIITAITLTIIANKDSDNHSDNQNTKSPQ